MSLRWTVRRIFGGKSQHSSGTGSPLPKGIIPLASDRRDKWFHRDPPMVAHQSPCWLQAPWVPTQEYLLYIPKPSRSILAFLTSQDFLLSNTLYNGKVLLSPDPDQAVAILPPLADSPGHGQSVFLSALYSSRCL